MRFLIVAVTLMLCAVSTADAAGVVRGPRGGAVAVGRHGGVVARGPHGGFYGHRGYGWNRGLGYGAAAGVYGHRCGYYPYPPCY